jgi:hypothetical protein
MPKRFASSSTTSLFASRLDGRSGQGQRKQVFFWKVSRRSRRHWPAALRAGQIAPENLSVSSQGLPAWPPPTVKPEMTLSHQADICLTLVTIMRHIARHFYCPRNASFQRLMSRVRLTWSR